MLEVQGLKVSYGAVEALHGVSVSVAQGEIVTIIGANGAGKSTLLRTICGVLRPTAGRIELAGQDVTRDSSPEMIRRGVALVPEGRHVFPELTVRENLDLGAYYRRDTAHMRQDLERVLELFPILREKLSQNGGLLSGGQQQQLAIARALLTDPKVLMLDEPTEGIQPSVIKDIGRVIRMLADRGMTPGQQMAIVLVEQFYDFAAELADQYLVMERGEIIQRGRGKDMEAEGVRAKMSI
jgi:urea transport system ATP-binding protein